MAHTHAHAASDAGNERALRLALVLTTGFLIAEIVGGILTHSLALISDAAHTLATGMLLLVARFERGQTFKPKDASHSEFPASLGLHREWGQVPEPL